MQLAFDPHGNDKQYEVFRLWADDKTTHILYGGSKGNGKSFLGCSIISSMALMYPGTYYFIARKNANDIRKYTIPSIYEVLGIWGIDARYYRFDGRDNFFEFYNDSRIYLVDAKYMPTDPLYARYGSMQMTQGWIEEAGEFCAAAYSNLSATIGRWKNQDYGIMGKLLMTCNPSKNFLYTDYYKPYKDGTLSSWKAFVQALPTDNHMLPPSYLINLERSLSPNEKQRLLYGNWEFDDNPDLLVTYDAVCDCFTNEPPNTNALPAISADLAMKGRDRFVSVLWQGSTATIKTDTNYSTARDIEDHLQALARTYNVGRSRIIADSDGLGAYLADYLQGIKEFHGGATAIDSATFANLKSECAYKLAERINNRQLRIVCNKEQEERIKDELMMLIADNAASDTTKKKLLSKEKIKQLIGHSPDYLDALLMGMFFDLRPASQGIRRVSLGKQTF